MQFNPCVSHYRREHAPHRLYLPSDIKIKDMYTDYLRKHPDENVSYETYRKVVTDDMNISFNKLGHEECDTCTIQDRHLETHVKGNAVSKFDEEMQACCANDNKSSENEVAGNHGATIMFKRCKDSENYAKSCETCKNFLLHSDKAKISREAYTKDISKISSLPNVSLRSVDLQKVIMLPRIPGSKKVCFTRRIVVFHQTFAVMEDQKRKSKKHISVLWHEAVVGRKAEEIASCHCTTLTEERDAAHVVYWVDNCSAQNKN